MPLDIPVVPFWSRLLFGLRNCDEDEARLVFNHALTMLTREAFAEREAALQRWADDGGR